LNPPPEYFADSCIPGQIRPVAVRPCLLQPQRRTTYSVEVEIAVRFFEAARRRVQAKKIPNLNGLGTIINWIAPHLTREGCREQTILAGLLAQGIILLTAPSHSLRNSGLLRFSSSLHSSGAALDFHEIPFSLHISGMHQNGICKEQSKKVEKT